MFSLNIKDYLIAALVLALIGLGALTFYDKAKIATQAAIIEKSKSLASVQKEKIELLKKHSKKTEEYLNEKYEVELGILNNTIDRMRNSRPSLMPSVPKGSRDPSTACFSREELDEAIRRYREGVQGLVGKGSKGILESNIAKEWIKKEQELYEYTTTD